MDKTYQGIIGGAGQQCGSRQPEVPSLVGQIQARIELTEIVVGQLLQRLDPLFNQNSAVNSQTMPRAEFGSALGRELGDSVARLDALEARIRYAISQLEI